MHERAPKYLKKEDYLKELKRAGTFQTVSSFWKCWMEVQQICNVNSPINYHLFKEPIKPIWEDSNNIKGGKWVVVMPSSTTQEQSIKLWISLMVTVLFGDWGLESEINGVVLSVRSWGNMFCVWSRTAKDKHLIHYVSEKLKELFGVETVKFQRHQSNVRRNHSEKANQFRRINYSSDDSISSGSDNSPSEREQEVNSRPKRRSTVTSVNKEMIRDIIHANMEAPLSPPFEEIQKGKAVREPEVLPTPLELKIEAPVLAEFLAPAPLVVPDVVVVNSTTTETTKNWKKIKKVVQKPSQLKIESVDKPNINAFMPVVEKKVVNDLNTVGIGLFIVGAIATSVLSWMYL